MRAGSQIFAALLLGSLSCPVWGADLAKFKPRAEHVVLCVWDGMRPDFVTAELTPHLFALAQRGTYFTDNHSQYVTTTEVNGTVLATGVFPERSGVVGNREFRRAIDPLKPFATENALAIKKGDALSGGAYLTAMTVAELCQKAGWRTAVAGTKPVALLHDRNFDRTGKNGSAVLFAGKTYPETLLASIASTLGAFPETADSTVLTVDAQPNTGQNTWTTRALTEVLWKEAVPKYSVLWLGDPDFSQHLTAPGSPTARAAIADCDRHLGLVLAALETRGELDKTDIFVVSDHGFSTVTRQINLVTIFKAAGIEATREFKWAPKAGELLVVNVGGSTSLYVIGHVPEVIQKIVDILQTSEFAGPIFTRAALPGTFALHDGHLESADAPDVLFSFRSVPGKNQFETPGLIFAEAKRGFGTHGTLGKTDIHNTLIAAGPDIRQGFRDLFPSANLDVAPTLLRLLGLTPAASLDGRILSEALAGVDFKAPEPVTKRLEATRELPDGAVWKQFIQTREFAGRVYVDEGGVGERLGDLETGRLGK